MYLALSLMRSARKTVGIQTRELWQNGGWEEILSHPGFTLASRELGALERFLPMIAKRMQGEVNIMHLGVGNGREIRHFIRHFPKIVQYVLNDVCEQALDSAVERARREHPRVQFAGEYGDVETSGVIPIMRRKLRGATLMALTANDASVLGIGLGVTSLVVGGKRLARSWPWRRIR